MGSLQYQDTVLLANPYMHSTPTIFIDKISPSPLIPFLQRSSNRSPIESPPASKKPLVRTGSLQQDPTPTAGDRSFTFETFTLQRRPSPPTVPGQRAVGKENRSILKRSPGFTVSRSSSLRGRRKVDFEPSVQVFHFDKVAGDHVSFENQKLSVEPHDRKAYMRKMTQNKFHAVEAPTQSTSSNSSSSLSNGASTNGESPDGRVVSQRPQSTSSAGDQQRLSVLYVNGDQTASRPPPRPLPIPQSVQTPDSYIPGAVDFTFFEDESRRLRIKFTIPLGEGVSASDVLVKANMTGNKVRVVASRTVRGVGSSTQREEFNERYLLPMEVDPYLITARLDSSGNLFVEAPILTAERKRALGAEKTVYKSIILYIFSFFTNLFA